MTFEEDKADRPPYTVSEAAAKLRMSEFAVRGALRRGDLPGFKLGRDWRLLSTPIDRLVSGETAA